MRRRCIIRLDILLDGFDQTVGGNHDAGGVTGPLRLKLFLIWSALSVSACLPHCYDILLRLVVVRVVRSHVSLLGIINVGNAIRAQVDAQQDHFLHHNVARAWLTSSFPCPSPSASTAAGGMLHSTLAIHTQQKTHSTNTLFDLFECPVLQRTFQ